MTGLALPPDGEKVRAVIHLASYAQDLGDALHSIECALRVGPDDETWPMLTGYATIAFCRCFVASSVRPPLDTWLKSADMPALHDTVRTYRNTTVAHSQSELTMPLALARIDQAGRVDGVFPVTVSHLMPVSVAENLRELIASVDADVSALLQGLVDELQSEVQRASPEDVARWGAPILVSGRAEEFFTRTKRNPAAPAFVTYWDDLEGADG